MEDAQRMNQIMQMDTRALLSTIKDLESKLSQYQRQDIVPPWASALMPRMDRLEESLRNVNIMQSRLPQEGEAPQSRDDLVRDDRLMARVKSELHTHAESTSLLMEAKAAAMGAEIERLHKLLQIRPTTSEYQKVMFIVNDQASQMKHDMQDIQSRLMDVVHTSIAKEIGAIMNGIKGNESINDRSIDGIIRRIELVSKDFYELKVSTHTDYEHLTAEQRCHGADIEQLKTTIAANEAKIKNDFSRVHGILADHANTATAQREAHDALGEELKEMMHQLELSVKNDHNEASHDMRRLADRFEFQIRDVKIYADSLQQQVEEMRMQSLLKHNELATGICEIKDTIETNRTQQNQVLIMLEKLHELDVTAKIAAMKARLDASDEGLRTLEARVAEAREEAHLADQRAADLRAGLELSADSTTRRFDEVYSAMEECQRAIEVGSNDASMLSDALLEVKTTVSDLSNLRSELDYVKQINSGSIEMVNALQERVEGLDAMLRYVSESATAAEKRSQAEFDQLSNRVEESLVESQADIEARLEQIQEQMVASSADAGNGRSSGALSAASKPRSRKKSVVSAPRSDDESDEESVASRRRPARGMSNASGASSRSSRQSKTRRQSVAYPVEGAPVVGVASSPDDQARRPKALGKVGRQPSSRGVLLGANGSSSSRQSQRVPATIIDSGETPPVSRHGTRIEPSGSDAVHAKVSSSVPASVTNSPRQRTTSGVAAAAGPASSPLQQAFFGDNAEQFEVVGDVHVIPAAHSEVLEPASRNQRCDSDGGAEPQSHSSPRLQQTPMGAQSHGTVANNGQTGAAMTMGDGLKRKTGSEDASSLGGSESLNSGPNHSKPVPSNPTKVGIGAGSVSVQPSSMRQVVSGFAGGASGNAGYSSAYKYEPNGSSMTLQTNSLLRPKSRPASGFSDELPFEDRAVHELLDVADRIFELGLHFEEIAVRRSLVPDIAEESCSELAAMCQSVGETVAKLVDTEALLRILRARPDQPVYGDAFIANRRLRLVDELLQAARSHLEKANPEAGITRLDARDYFMKKVEKVMQLSLSKHDQVLLPTQTRAGKVKIPSCIACDRPLLQKVRGDMVTRSEVGGRSQIVPFGSTHSQAEKEHFQSLDEGSFYGEQDSLMSKSADGFNMGGALKGKGVGIPSSLPRQPSRGGVSSLQKANPLDIGSRGAKTQEGAYTLMAGFKMPKKSSKTKYADDKYLFSSPLETGSRQSGEMDMSGSGAAGYLGSPNSKGSSKY